MPDSYVTELIIDASPAEAGADAYAAAIAKVVAAQGTAAAGADEVVRTTDSIGRSISAMGGASATSLDKLLRGVDPLLDAYRQIEDAQRRLAQNSIKASSALSLPDISPADRARITAQLSTIAGLSDDLASVKMNLATGAITPEQASTQTQAVFRPRQSAAEGARLAAERDAADQMAAQQAAQQEAERQDAAMRRLLSTYDETAAATHRLTQAEAELSAALQAVDAAQANGGLGPAAADGARASLGGALAQVQALRTQVETGQIAGGDAIDKLGGLTAQSQAASRRAAAAAEQQAAQQQDAAMRSLLATYDQTYAATQRLAKAETELSAALRAVDTAQANGSLGPNAAAGARASLGSALSQTQALRSQVENGAMKGGDALRQFNQLAGQAEGGSRRMSIAQMELMAASSHAFDALAAGADPMRVLAMEGGRVAEAAALSGISLTGVALAAAAVVAPFALAALAAHQVSEAHRETQRVLAMTGGYLGQTADQFQATADQAAASAGISRSSALSLAQGYAATGQIGGQALQGLTTVTRSWARATGTSMDEASKSLAQMFVDPSKGAEELARTTHQVGIEELTRIGNMQHSGDLYGAQVELLHQIQGILENIAKVRPEKNSIWDKLDHLGNDALNAWRNFGEMVSPPDTDQSRLESAQKQQRQAHTTLDAFRATVGANPTGLDAETLAQLQGRADAVDQAAARIQQKVANAGANAKAAQDKANASTLGLQAKPLIETGVEWERQQVKNDLETLTRAHNAQGISDQEYAQSRQRLQARLGAIETPFEKWKDQQSIDARVRAAPQDQRQALRARLMAENSLQGVDASDQEKAAMAAGAYSQVLADQARAQADHALALDMDTASLQRVADAYRVSTAAVQAAEVQRQLEAEALTNSAVKADAAAEAQRRLARAAAEAKIALARSLSELRDRVEKGEAGSYIGDPLARSQAQIAEQARLWAKPDMDAAKAQTDPVNRARDLAAAQDMQQQYEDLLTRQAAIPQRAQLSAQIASGTDDLTYMQQEISLLGMDADAREIAIAKLKEEQRIRQEMPQLYASTDPRDQALIGQRINQAGQVAAMQQQVQQQKAAYDEVSGFASHAADSVGNAFTNMLTSGHSAAVGMRDIWSSVVGSIEQELVQLAITNPLKNLLLGSSLPTSSGLFGGVFGDLFGGGDSLMATDATSVAPFSLDEGGGLMAGIGFATGGYITGPGTGTSDSIPARLSHGEYVINAAATAQYRPLLDHINNNPTPSVRPAPAVRHYATGGYVDGGAGGAAGGTGSPTINVHNYGNNDVEVHPFKGPDGGDQVNVFIRQRMRADIGSGNLDQTMANRYALTPTPVRRS